MSDALVVPHDAANESAVVAAAAIDPEIRAKFTRLVRPDHFAARENILAWAALTELSRKKLKVSREALEKVANDEVAAYIEAIAEEGKGAVANVDWHVSSLFWDATRIRAAKGVVPAFLEALRDPKADPEKLRALARAIPGSLDGDGTRGFLHDEHQIVLDQMVEIRARVGGRAVYPFGIRGLDFYDQDATNDKGESLAGKRRLIPGAAPGMVTVITSLTGGGKTTSTAHLVLGLARQKRKVLYGAWEMKGGMTLELLACISLGWSRSELMVGEGIIATEEGQATFQARMTALSKYVRFMSNPFRRKTGEKGRTNDHNLDLLQGYIEDCGCDVFVADLWKRCLVDTAPEAEEDALFRQQAMAEETRTHHILLVQQRFKDIEQRADKRPTREGVKGSGAYVEIADNLFGMHLPSMWKKVSANYLEWIVLKQRYGKWPIVVEFDWDGDAGQITGGRAIPYDRPGEGNDLDIGVGGVLSVNEKKGKGGGRWKR